MRSNKTRLIIGAVIALFGLVSYFFSTQTNPVTGEKQHVGNLTAEQETQMGLQAAPEMVQQMGGELADPALQDYVERVGQQVVSHSDAQKGPYKFDFHLLADPETVNAFALPGGQVFITTALLSKLQNEAQLAGVLGHEVGHVIGRHGAEHMAKSRLGQTMVGAVAVGASDDQGHGRMAAMAAVFATQMIDLKYGRNDENEADKFGVRFMTESGYDPQEMIGVMQILKAASGSGGRQPEFFSTHPDPGNRIESIRQDIQTEFPQGLPADLTKAEGSFQQNVGNRLQVATQP